MDEWWNRAPYRMPGANVPAPNPYMPQAQVPGSLDQIALMLRMGGVRGGAMNPQQPARFDGFSENAAPVNYASPMYGGGFSENALPLAPYEQPLPPPPRPPARARPRNMLTAAAGGGMTAEDLNAISLSAARGEEMPSGVAPELWARIRGR